ncbi:ribonuclease E/G [Leptothermofonsia sichuanensis E412]|uniref:Rne/Rng family ribonuclease n=1 Tax=Leptothermofonsia sichuanensis TaxID=2917832 RepID=UPI001CA64449|nr:Rne/Rng family ribonuclease [Leptothermofonsia sichuanensis]QZZ23019.1 ribonuclease E/G [Leptothermofonsia sichuanensis E412]
MPKQIIIAEQHRIAAVFSEDQIQELIVATGSHQVSDIYLGIVENVLPGIDAAFVNIGDSERNGFIHVTDLGPLRKRRTAGSITELLEPQQKVLVQIMKEPTGNKGPRLTGNISLPGRYLVLMPYGKGVNLSRRIRNENERNRLRALAILVKPAGMGIVVRTEAEGMPEDAIIEDLEALQRQWENVLQEAMTTRAPALLNRDDDFIQKVLRDVYSADVNRIVVDSHTGLKRVKQHLMNWGGGKMPPGVLIDHHRDRIPILEYFRVNPAIREALKPRVDLPSGGYIVIERTEALTVIDVNSGSFTRSATARETVLWTNCEAATEIARQLRLRNIAGVIVVDFIDMDSRRDQLQVLEHFNKALRADKARPQIAQLSELGLVELTRKRQGKNIYEIFGRSCPTCGGIGHLVHLPGEPDSEEGEPIERPAAAIREPRTIEARGRRGRDSGLPDIPGVSDLFWEDRSEDTDDGNDLQDIGLSHPNYQEVGGNNRRRRRRRDDDRPPRTGYGAPVAKAEPGTDADPYAPAEESAFPVRNERGRGRGRGRGRDGDRNETGGAPPEPSTLQEATEAGYGDERRSRRRDSNKPTEPPEFVSVEMTPEEQDVYAWMGISPLTLATQEVKNPKSAIISIVLPGEAPPPVELETSAAVTTSGGSTVQAPVRRSPIKPEEDGAISAPELSSPVEVSPVQVTSEPEPSEPEGAVVRRRRRRSSAAAGE